MNVSTVSLVVAFALASSPMVARSETTSVPVARNTVGVSSMVSASVAGLSMASIQAMPGFPVKAYREGYREARVVLRYTVKADGTVGNVEVLEAKPLEHFTRAASSAVAAWRFAPTGATELRKVEFRFSVE